MQVIVDGLLTHFERRGDDQKQTILILPGWADTSRSWTSIGQLLSGDFDVIMLDLPGFGGSQMPAQTWGLDDYVQFVQHFLQKIEVKKLFAVIGHSNGGAMAIRAVSQHKLQSQKLVLLASAGIRGTEKGRKFGLKILAKTGKIAAKPLPQSMQQNLRAKLYKAAGSDMLVAEHMQETFKRIVDQDVRDDAAEIHIPTLLIYGDKDTDALLAYGKIFHQLITGSRLETLPGAGHFLHVENSDVVVKNIKEFLA